MMNEETKKYIYDYDDFSFSLFIPDYWERVYNGKEREKLYPDYCAMLDIVKLVDKKKYIIDVGANHGIFCIPAAMLGYNVMAFEPVKSNFLNLGNAMRYNKIQTLSTYRWALSNEEGEKEIYVPECHDNASFSHEAAIANMQNKIASIETVKCKRFDDLFDPKDNNIGLIKIDAQGSEYDIIKGMDKTLSASEDIYLIVEYEDHLLKMGHTYEQLDELISSHGFADIGRIGNDKLFYKP